MGWDDDPHQNATPFGSFRHETAGEKQLSLNPFRDHAQFNWDAASPQLPDIDSDHEASYGTGAPNTPQVSDVQPRNPFALRRAGSSSSDNWDWPVTPDSNLTSLRGSLADVDGSCMQPQLWNTDRDMLLPHALIMEGLTTGAAHVCVSTSILSAKAIKTTDAPSKTDFGYISKLLFPQIRL